MIKEEIEYINDLGYHKTLTIIPQPQNNGLYFMAISYRGDIVSFERNCTEQRVQEFRKKILDHKIILAIKKIQIIIILEGVKYVKRVVGQFICCCCLSIDIACINYIMDITGCNYHPYNMSLLV